MTIKTDEQATTLAWHKGAFAGKNVWYDDDPYYIYYPADQYEDDLRNGVGSDVADLILNVKDALVKNGAWDITGADCFVDDERHSGPFGSGIGHRSI